MKKSIKRIGVCLAAALCLGAAGACAPKGGTSKTVNLEIWTYYNSEQKIAFERYVTMFNETVGRKEKINVTHLPYGGVTDLADAVRASVAGEIAARAKPDLFQTYADDLWALDEEFHATAALDDYFTAQELGNYEADYLNDGRFGDGRLKLIPVAKSTECLMMNKEAWDAFAEGRDDVSLNMLSTMEGIVKVSEIYYNETGKAFYGRDAMANYLLVGAKSLGQEIIVAENGKESVHLDKTAFRTLYDNFYVPYVKGWFDARNQYRSKDVKDEIIVAYTGSTSSAVNFPDTLIVDDDSEKMISCYAAPAPLAAAGERYAMQQGAGIAVMANQDKAREKACCTFLKFLTEAERNTEFAVSLNYLPVVKQTDPMTAIKDALIRRIWNVPDNPRAEEEPTAAEKEAILRENAKFVSVYETALDTVEEATMWASAPTSVSAQLRKVFEVCIQGDVTKGNIPGMAQLVNAQGLRAKIEDGSYQGTPEDYFDIWFAQLETVVGNVTGANEAA